MKRETSFFLSMPGAVYIFFKWLTMLLIPAAAVLYFALGSIWGLPNPEQVVGVLTAIDLFLGVMLGISSKNYMNSTGVTFAEATDNFALSNQLYDALKWIAQIFLPALGTLYFSLAMVLMLPYAEQVVGTIAAVDTFLGIILGISTVQYTKKE